MRISRRTSGGRGEYEISEDSPEGISPRDLFGHRLVLDMGGNWTIDTATVLTEQGGKRRIRRIGQGIQVHRQIAAGLLLPYPVRADGPLGRGQPVAKSNQYAIEQIDLGAVKVKSGVAVLEAKHLQLRNLSHHAEEISVGQRRQHLEHLWNRSTLLPDPLAALVAAHRALVTTGGPISEQAEKVIALLQQTLADTAADLGLGYRASGEDALPGLLEAIRWSQDPPQPPIGVDEVDPDETEIRRRVVKDWKRWAAARGAASARFRQEVRRAYNSTCLVCGLHLPQTPFSANPGVDAAHILPWAEYEADQVSNGLCLCKTHHWAFDEGLIVISAKGGEYFIEVPKEVKDGLATAVPAFSLKDLEAHVGKIPAARLPLKSSQRPSPKFLKKLRESCS